MFRCSIAAANTDKLQFKFKFHSYVMCNCVDDKNDNEERRAPLEYLPGPRVSSYATGNEARKELRYVTCVWISIYRLPACASGVQLYILVLFWISVGVC